MPKHIQTSLNQEQFVSDYVDSDFPDDHDQRVIADDGDLHIHVHGDLNDDVRDIIKRSRERQRKLAGIIGSGVTPEERTIAQREQQEELSYWNSLTFSTGQIDCSLGDVPPISPIEQ